MEHSERTVALVVHEDALMRRVISAVLAEAGFAVIQASEGEEAARRAAEARIDLVVLARDPSGPDVARQLRRLRTDLKALILSDQLTAGTDADALLHTPFRPDDIREAAVALAFGRCRCPSCLRRSQQAQPDRRVPHSTESTN